MNINNKLVKNKMKKDILELHDNDKRLIYENIKAGAWRESDPILVKCKKYVTDGNLLAMNNDIIEYLNSLKLKTERYEDEPMQYYAKYTSYILYDIYYKMLKEDRKD